MGAVKVEDLAAAIAGELESYRQDVADGLKQEARRVAKETVRNIKANAPRDTGEYAQGWTDKVAFESGESIRMQVYNRKKPQITHLLEHGHAKASGGRVDGKPHIGPAEQAAEKQLLGKIKVVVKG